MTIRFGDWPSTKQKSIIDPTEPPKMATVIQDVESLVDSGEEEDDGMESDDKKPTPRSEKSLQ